MAFKLSRLIWLVLFLPFSLDAQENPEVDQNIIQEETEEYKDTWTTPQITDEMTVDSEQNKSWRMGDYKFSSKPKHSWEFGLHFGHFFIDGDIDREIPGGWGVGLHLRKSLNYVLSLRGSLFYGMASGFEKQPYNHRNLTRANGIGGGLVEQVFDIYDPNTGGPGVWFPAHQTRYISGDISAIVNVGNILFHKERNKWNIYFGIGVGIDTHEARLDLLNDANRPYEDLVSRVNWTPEEFNTSAGRSRIESAIRNIYDGTYETEGFQKAGIFRIGDDLNVHFVFIPSFGISRKINKRFNIGIEHQAFLSDNDYLDGIKFRTSADQTNNVDIGHYTHVRIGINIGNFNKVTEPLYWLNPVDQAFNDLAIAKNQNQLDLVDEDNDGVIDLLDQELDTQEDCPVDTRGIILDSDGDGLADCEDREPYSRPGCPIDEFGIAQCEEDLESVRALIDSRLEEFRETLVLSEGGVANFSYGTTEKSGSLPDGATYILNVPTDKDGNIIASTQSTKEVSYPDGSGYILTLPTDENGSFVATDNATKTTVKEDGTKDVLSVPVDRNGNIVATKSATKSVTNPDGSGYILTLPIDSKGDYVPTKTAKKTVINPDGSGYVLTLPVDENGDFVATDNARKTVIKENGQKADYNVPVDSNGDIIVTANRPGANNTGGTMVEAPSSTSSKPTTSSSTGSTSNSVTVVNSGCGDWFLPMIHFDLNKSKIKPEYFSHLHNVAQVMKKCPNICVVAQGHTDSRSTNEYNRVLSYLRAKETVDYLTETYGIDKTRVKLMYGGEETPMVLNPATEAHHFMNRRVEFRTCDVNDFDMAPPEGAQRALQSKASKPQFYKGNKNSGY